MRGYRIASSLLFAASVACGGADPQPKAATSKVAASILARSADPQSCESAHETCVSLAGEDGCAKFMDSCKQWEACVGTVNECSAPAEAGVCKEALLASECVLEPLAPGDLPELPDDLPLPAPDTKESQGQGVEEAKSLSLPDAEQVPDCFCGVPGLPQPEGAPPLPPSCDAMLEECTKEQGGEHCKTAFEACEKIETCISGVKACALEGDKHDPKACHEAIVAAGCLPEQPPLPDTGCGPVGAFPGELPPPPFGVDQLPPPPFGVDQLPPPPAGIYELPLPPPGFNVQKPLPGEPMAKFPVDLPVPPSHGQNPPVPADMAPPVHGHLPPVGDLPRGSDRPALPLPDDMPPPPLGFELPEPPAAPELKD